MMALGTTDVSFKGIPLDEGGCKGSMQSDSHGEVENSNFTKAAKPPRNLLAMRHSISQATFAGTSKLVSKSQ
ncbi:hypothetical protein LguiA_005582 [Lonicera macranthoides]